MKHKNNWINYFSPIIGILFCPVTILFLWSIFTGPIVLFDNELIEVEKQ